MAGDAAIMSDYRDITSDELWEEYEWVANQSADLFDFLRGDNAEAMTENDECPVCKCGTLEKNENDLVCRGECGAPFPDELGRYAPKEEA